MARITVEDCLKNNDLENRFELVVLASKRGKDLAEGAKPMINRDNDKNAVVALREIAANKLDLDAIRRTFADNYHSHLSSQDDDVADEDDDLKEQIYEEIGSLTVESDDDLSFDLDEEIEEDTDGEDSDN